MLTLTDQAAIEAALADPDLDPHLVALITARVAQLTEDLDEDLDLGEVAQIHIIQPGDAHSDVEIATGFPFDQTSDQPPWEWIEDHGGWIEAVLVVSDDGFGHVLYAPDLPGIDPVLISMFRNQPMTA